MGAGTAGDFASRRPRLAAAAVFRPDSGPDLEFLGTGHLHLRGDDRRAGRGLGDLLSAGVPARMGNEMAVADGSGLWCGHGQQLGVDRPFPLLAADPGQHPWVERFTVASGPDFAADYISQPEAAGSKVQAHPDAKLALGGSDLPRPAGGFAIVFPATVDLPGDGRRIIDLLEGFAGTIKIAKSRFEPNVAIFGLQWPGHGPGLQLTGSATAGGHPLAR